MPLTVTTHPQKVLLTGGSGLVGSRVAELLRNKYTIATPARDELDITVRDDVLTYVENVYPDVIIHAAAFTDAAAAERQRGRTDGACWYVNVDGTKYLIDAAKRVGAYFIYISTGSVFSGTKDNPGPFTEFDEPLSDPSRLSWYGWTKRCGELVLLLRASPVSANKPIGAIIRISHPVKKEGAGVERDYIHNLLNLYKKGSLYPLFTDQFFPITWIDDVAHGIDRLLMEPRSGIFHVASPDLVSPYELIQYVLTRQSRPGLDCRVRKASMEEFLKKVDQPPRFTQFCAIDSRNTQRLLRVKFKTWKEIVIAVSI